MVSNVSVRKNILQVFVCQSHDSFAFNSMKSESCFEYGTNLPKLMMCMVHVHSQKKRLLKGSSLVLYRGAYGTLMVLQGTKRVLLKLLI